MISITPSLLGATSVATKQSREMIRFGLLRRSNATSRNDGVMLVGLAILNSNYQNNKQLNNNQ
ncbi:hypothetical protein [Candidatus Tisiphia endosymbiont of Hybos culiciformis]|uniref:hypothetical protein n=1 Tax=Candidatus Tisiphia endosymbiont of Hybos culiciformis TaxID=3139331 RepID=UPI003CCABDE6